MGCFGFVEWIKGVGVVLIGVVAVGMLLFDWHDPPAGPGLALAFFGGLAFLLGFLKMLFTGRAGSASAMQYVLIVAAIPLCFWAYEPSVLAGSISFSSILFRMCAIAYGIPAIWFSGLSLAREISGD